MAVASSNLTLEEFLKLPEREPALEYVDGLVIQKMSPKARHALLQSDLAARINAVARPARVALALTEARATFAGASRVPDVAVYRWARIPFDDAGDIVDDLREPPDIVIEIVSPGQSANAPFRRCRWYASNGVEIALLIDPDDRSVLAFRAEAAVGEWHGADRIDITSVVPEFELSVEGLFASLRIN